MIVFRYENRHPRSVLRSRNAPLNREMVRDGLKPLRKILQIELEAGQVPLDACQIKTFLSRLMLLEVKDVAAVPINEIYDRRIEALAVRTLQKQDGAVFHLGLPFRSAILLKSSRNRRRSEEHTSELQSRQYLVCRL